MIDGPTLRDLRRRRRLTQAELASRTGIPHTVLSAYERGRRVPGLDAAARIIDALGFRVQFVDIPDPAAQGRDLEAVLTLADALPFEARPPARARR